MTTATTTEELNEVYNHVYDKFKSSIRFGSIHNFLWQVIINEINKGSNCTFYNVYSDGEHLLTRVFENEDGYSPTGIVFYDNITDKEAQEICYYMNEKIFSQTKAISDEIVDSSFKVSFKK